MAYVDTVVVNGTEYEINTQSSKYPVVCETSSSGIIDRSVDEDAQFTEKFELMGAWRRTGTTGNYKYSLAVIGVGGPEGQQYHTAGTAGS